MLTGDKDFLERFLKTIPQKGAFDAARTRLEQKKARVVLAFIHNKEKITPSGLPFNIKLALYKGLLDIEKLGIKCNIISIKDDTTKLQRTADAAQEKVASTSDQNMDPSEASEGDSESEYEYSEDEIGEVREPSLASLSPEQEKKMGEFLRGISERYIRAIKNAGSEGEVLWGGDVELIEIAVLRNLRIIVYQNAHGIATALPSIGPVDGRPVYLWYTGNHYENYDPTTGRIKNGVPLDGNCLFHAVLRAMHDLDHPNTPYDFNLAAVAHLRNEVANAYTILIRRIDNREQETRDGTPENGMRPIQEILTHENNNAIYVAFARIFEAETEAQLAEAIEYLPPSNLRDEAVRLRRGINMQPPSQAKWKVYASG